MLGGGRTLSLILFLSIKTGFIFFDEARFLQNVSVLNHWEV